MNSVIVCIVLAIAANAGSFVVLDRTNADLEESIRDFYSPMGSKIHHSSNINTDVEENYSEETEEEYELPSDIEITPNDYFDQDGTRSRIREYEDKPRKDIDENVLQAIWAESSASSKKQNDEEANNTFGSTFEDEYRFLLSRTFLKKKWEKNDANEQKPSTRSLQHEIKSLRSLEPEQQSTASRAQSNPLQDQRSSSHREHSLFKTSGNTALDIMKIFGSPDSPPGSMISSTESYLATNETGSTFKEEDRFLSQSLLRSHWENNLEEDEKSAITTNPLPEKRKLSRREQDIVIPTQNNASNKHTSTLLALTLACLFLVSYS